MSWILFKIQKQHSVKELCYNIQLTRHDKQMCGKDGKSLAFVTVVLLYNSACRYLSVFEFLRCQRNCLTHMLSGPDIKDEKLWCNCCSCLLSSKRKNNCEKNVASLLMKQHVVGRSVCTVVNTDSLINQCLLWEKYF